MRRIVFQFHVCPIRLLGPYGCEWTATPTLDHFAAEGVVFDRHYATQLDSKASPLQYAQTVEQFDLKETARQLEALKNSENGVLIIHLNDFELPWGEWKDGPFPGDSEVQWNAFFEKAAEITAAFDERFSQIIEQICDSGVDQSAVMIFTALSGLPLGEHGVLGTSQSRLHEELVQLPLIVRFPDERLAGYRVPNLTIEEDLVPLLSTGSTEYLESLIHGTIPARESLISSLGSPVREMAYRSDDTCLIVSHGSEPAPTLLFNRPDDRFEVNELAVRQQERVEELLPRLQIPSQNRIL